MNTVTTSIDSSTGDVKIEWVAPNDNGSPVTSYTIEILESDLSTYT